MLFMDMASVLAVSPTESMAHATIITVMVASPLFPIAASTPTVNLISTPSLMTITYRANLDSKSNGNSGGCHCNPTGYKADELATISQ